MHAARSGRPGHTLLPKVCRSANLANIYSSSILPPVRPVNLRHCLPVAFVFLLCERSELPGAHNGLLNGWCAGSCEAHISLDDSGLRM